PHTWAQPVSPDEASPAGSSPRPTGSFPSTLGSIRFLPSGRRDGEWAARYNRGVAEMDWADFYEVWAGGSYFEFFRKDLETHSDIVLIDSRTGVTELGGISTHHLADLVLVFTAANDQNIQGSLRMIESLRRPDVRQQRDGREIGVLPVASRIDLRGGAGLGQK